MKVLCFGSLNIDYTYKLDHFVQKGETISSENLIVCSGGKGLNQSIALSKAGADAYHAGAIGEDGRFLLEQLEEAGVDTECVAVLADVRSGNAIIQNDKSGDNCIILYGGANQAITKEQVDDVMQRFEKDDFLVLQNEINELDYIMKCASEKGMKIVLNPSPMNEKILRLPLECVDYFMVNEIETSQILEKENVQDMSGVEMAKELRAKFPNAAIVLTMGEMGSLYMDSNEIIEQPAYKVQAVDTTAAGDTFAGFFIGGIMKGLEVKDAMNEAAKASAIAVTRQGAAPSIPTWEELEKF
ncbi:MAG: ribokinase [Tyzzerella sp.]|nr:ribokinase [Tyzzerella sp.]